MKKKGNIFLIEFIAVIPFLLAFFIYLQPYLIETHDESANLKQFAQQSVTILRDTRVSDLPLQTIEEIPPYLRDESLSISHQLVILVENKADLIASGHWNAVRNLSNASFAVLIPDRYYINISFEGANTEEIELRGEQKVESLMAHSTLVPYISDTPKSTDVYVLRVKVWT